MNPLIILAQVLQVYILVLTIRIFLSWVSLDANQPLVRILAAVTDPWFRLFRGFRLQLGNFDFSPMIAIGVLIVLQGLTYRLALEGSLTVGIVTSALLAQLWLIVSSIVFLVGAMALVRFLAVQFRWGGAAVWHFLDALLQPMTFSLGRLLRRDAFFPYTFSLLIVVVLAVVVTVAGGIGIGLLVLLLEHLPF
ncbi:MAG: YggT family protein [Spirochaetales bacterium]